MGLEPIAWGPHVWAAIHIICLGAPESFAGSDHLSYRKFFDALPYVLPCEKCREHLKAHMERYPIDAALSGGKATLFAWSVQLHNAVNRSLNKPEMSVSDARAHWTSVLEGTVATTKQSPPERKCSKHVLTRIYVSIAIILICGILLGLIASNYVRN